MTPTPFKIAISEDELNLLRRKLELTRIPKFQTAWTEENGHDNQFIQDALKFWLNEYDWKAEEAKLNKMPQYILPIEVDEGFGTLDIHFVHSPSSSTSQQNIPLLFIHGWPGSFAEIEKGLPLLNEAGFTVVAPSLPGYGFSSYTTKHGFDLRKHAEVFHKLMRALGYNKYVVQGGDWGATIAHTMGILYADEIVAIHQNMLLLPDKRKQFTEAGHKYTDRETHHLDRFYDWYFTKGSSYAVIQGQRPLTLGYALHDSPIGLFAWFADKFKLWSDNYPWTMTELITFTLLHYFPGPTPGFITYHENSPLAHIIDGSWATAFVKVPYGISAFPQEIIILPRAWAEQHFNVVFWKEHQSGGHFAMYEKPEALVADLVEFFRGVWKD